MYGHREWVEDIDMLLNNQLKADLSAIPMGYTNSMQIQHGDVTFLLQDEIPHVTIPFVNDIPIKGPATRYETEDGYEVIQENPGI